MVQKLSDDCEENKEWAICAHLKKCFSLWAEKCYQ